MPLDTIKINGDSHFKSEMNIDEPEMYYLFLDRGVSNSLDNNIVFFAEKGKIKLTQKDLEKIWVSVIDLVKVLRIKPGDFV